MNNTIMLSVTVTAEWQPLSAAKLVCSCTISTPPDNTGDVTFKGDNGSETPWQAGEWHEFRQVDLSRIYVKGTAGDTVTVVGGTW